MAINLSEEAILRFSRGYRLQHDKIRQQWTIQAPERAYLIDEIAYAILSRLDGITPLEAIITELSTLYQAPRATVAQDVLMLLTDLKNKAILRL